MQYRTLGRTGLRVSALGFGAMRLPMAGEQVDYDLAVPLLRRALDLGVNYIDSAFLYCNGTSEIGVGKAIDGWPRERILISTKQVVSSPEDLPPWRGRLETQLERLGTSYVDVFHCHALTWEQFEAYVAPRGGVLDQARRAQSEGLLRHLSLSSHDTPANLRKLIATGEFDSVTLQYNFLDRSYAEVIDFARQRGVGVVVMGPVGGGRLTVSTEVLRRYARPGRSFRSTPEIALRFVLANPGVSVALSGMTDPRQVDENAATASRPEPLSPAEFQQVGEAFGEIHRLADLYCTGCGYCLPCPSGVNIPDNFRLMNYHRLYQVEVYPRHQYELMVKNGRGPAEVCTECGQCEPKCPQHIPIPERLREVVATLG